MQTTPFEAALTWGNEMLAVHPQREPGVRRHLTLEVSGEGFGLLEADAQGWMLCIPDGAQLEASVCDAPLDVGRLSLDPGGERRLRLRAGLRACVHMGEFLFEVRPTA